jgi:Ca2+-binding RTX toxin-like protein
MEILGTFGHDILVGSIAPNEIFALGGNDRVTGLGGSDRIFGNAGNDVLAGNAGRDTIFGGRDDDTILGGQDDDRLYGDLGFDIIAGGLGDDVIQGGTLPPPPTNLTPTPKVTGCLVIKDAIPSSAMRERTPSGAVKITIGCKERPATMSSTEIWAAIP